MKHYLATVSILVITAAIHLSFLNAHDRAAQMNPPQDVLNIPAVIGGFRQVGQDQEVDERTKAALLTSVILMRNYVSPRGLPVQLSIVYAGTSRRSMHFPEVCLVGAGWEVREQSSRPMGILFTAKKLVLVKGVRREAVLYWVKTGDKLTGNYFLNAWHWARTVLRFGSATSAMIKVTAPITSQGEEATFAVLEDFATILAPILTRRVK